MIYCYYDKYGILREIVNDSDNRQGSSSEATKIFVYYEDYENVKTMSATYKVGSYTSQTYLSNGINETQILPYSSKINYKYFKDNTPYRWQVFEVPTEILQLGADDDVATNVSVTFYVEYYIDKYSSNSIAQKALGLLTFNLQSSVINTDNLITTSQMDYLLNQLAKYDFIAANGIVGVYKGVEHIKDGIMASSLHKEGLFVLQVDPPATFDLFRVIDGVYRLQYSTQHFKDLVVRLIESQPVAVYYDGDTLVFEDANYLFRGEF